MSDTEEDLTFHEGAYNDAARYVFYQIVEAAKMRNAKMKVEQLKLETTKQFKAALEELLK